MLVSIIITETVATHSDIKFSLGKRKIVRKCVDVGDPVPSHAVLSGSNSVCTRRQS